LSNYKYHILLKQPPLLVIIIVWPSYSGLCKNH